MNKYLWLIIIVFMFAASYGLYRLIFYNPIDSITNAKLDLSRPQPAVEPKSTASQPFLGPQLPPNQPPPASNNQLNQPSLPGPRLDNLPKPDAAAPTLPQNTLPNPGTLVGKWQSNSDSKHAVEFKSNNTVDEYIDGKLTASGTWQFDSGNNKTIGPNVQLLKVVMNGTAYNYQILNLSATNLSYIDSGQEGIQSYSRLP